MSDDSLAMPRRNFIREASPRRRFSSFLFMLAAPLSLFAAEPVDPREYRLVITPHVVSQAVMDDGRTALELELTIENGGSHDLYDLRLFLSPLNTFPLTQECAPARIRSLTAGGHGAVTWKYDCLLAPFPDPLLRTMRLRVEAVDANTHDIVGFLGTTTEGG